MFIRHQMKSHSEKIILVLEPPQLGTSDSFSLMILGNYSIPLLDPESK